MCAVGSRHPLKGVVHMNVILIGIHLAQAGGLEPPNDELTARCSTIGLRLNDYLFDNIPERLSRFLASDI